MSNPAITLVQSLYAAFKRGEIGPIIAALSPDVDWKVNGQRKDFPSLGSWSGAKAVERFFQTVGEHQQSKDFSPRDFFAVDDKVFVLGHYAWVIKKTGRPVDSDWVHIFTIRNGKVAAFREFNDTARFAEAFRG
jgi:ketosteroid isomerase-like protein